MEISLSKTLNVRGRLIMLDKPKVMGVLNISPDSFYAGSRFSTDSILAHVERILTEGVDFIDVGGYSSRPGADDISVDEELKRVIPVVRAIIKIFPEAIISVDTFRSEVAHQSIEEGASIINDIAAGLLDEKILDVVGQSQAPYIMMHMRGDPKTMNSLTRYENLVKEVIDYFHARIALAHAKGIKDIIIDPGFGFAKTVEQNFELLKSLNQLRVLDKPILVGLSRKSMIWRTLQVSPEEALNGSTVVHTLALINGATILRVHDVKEAKETVKLLESYYL